LTIWFFFRSKFSYLWTVPESLSSAIYQVRLQQGEYQSTATFKIHGGYSISDVAVSNEDSICKRGHDCTVTWTADDELNGRQATFYIKDFQSKVCLLFLCRCFFETKEIL
jgi:hypothetical protein